MNFFKVLSSIFTLLPKTNQMKFKIFSDVFKNIVWNPYSKKKYIFLFLSDFADIHSRPFLFFLICLYFKNLRSFSQWTLWALKLAPQICQSSLRLQDNVRWKHVWAIIQSWGSGLSLFWKKKILFFLFWKTLKKKWNFALFF